MKAMAVGNPLFKKKAHPGGEPQISLFKKKKKDPPIEFCFLLFNQKNKRVNFFGISGGNQVFWT